MPTKPTNPDEPELTPLPDPKIDPRSALTAGIPYPLATDPVAEGAAAMQAIAQYLSAHGFGEALYGFSSRPDATNINTLTKTGFYVVPNGVNAPVTDWVKYRVLNFDGLYVIQEATHMLSANMVGQRWVRQMISGGWSAWVASPPRIVCGIVSAAGAVVDGQGFTAARLSLGLFKVTFVTAFPRWPAVLATPQTAAGQTYCVVNALAADAIEIKMVNSAGGGADVNFSFICINTG